MSRKLEKTQGPTRRDTRMEHFKVLPRTRRLGEEVDLINSEKKGGVKKKKKLDHWITRSGPERANYPKQILLPEKTDLGGRISAFKRSGERKRQSVE